MTARRLSEALGLSLCAVRRKKYELGYLSKELEYWTEEQVNFLRSNYEKYGDTELAEMFSARWSKKKRWSKKHIEKKRMYLGLKRTNDQKKAIYQRNKAAGRWSECPVKAWKARGGAAPEGYTTAWLVNGRVTQFIKVNGKYVPHARHLYKQLYGEVPRDCVVRLKDGDPYNVTPENLELVSLRDHGSHNSRFRHDVQVKRAKAKAILKYTINLTEKSQNEYEKQIERFKQSSLCSA